MIGKYCCPENFQFCYNPTEIRYNPTGIRYNPTVSAIIRPESLVI